MRNGVNATFAQWDEHPQTSLVLDLFRAHEGAILGNDEDVEASWLFQLVLDPRPFSPHNKLSERYKRKYLRLMTPEEALLVVPKLPTPVGVSLCGVVFIRPLPKEDLLLEPVLTRIKDSVREIKRNCDGRARRRAQPKGRQESNRERKMRLWNEMRRAAAAVP